MPITASFPIAMNLMKHHLWIRQLQRGQRIITAAKTLIKQEPMPISLDAKGYPFAQVEYANDPTGRIERVGGIGPDHQFGKTLDNSRAAHYTEYFYTTPDNLELFYRFGNDVSDPSNYTKIITKDVQGQQSVAITDPMGRTVMTYLTGDIHEGTEAIEGNGASEAEFKDFMDL